MRIDYRQRADLFIPILKLNQVTQDTVLNTPVRFYSDTALHHDSRQSRGNDAKEVYNGICCSKEDAKGCN